MTTAIASLHAHPSARFDPFPLSEVQHACWIARGALVESGGVSSHMYLELDASGLDLPRLNAALLRLIERHDMLRAVVLPDGQQRVLRDVPPYVIEADDLRCANAEAFHTTAAQTRARMSHQVLPADRWPLFEFRATRGDAGALRLHCSLDMLMLDEWSVFTLFGEWRRAYDDPTTPATVADSTAVHYRDHVMALRAQASTPQHQRAETYWLGRLDDLPDPPALPLEPRHARPAPLRFTLRHGGLSARDWAALKQRAQAKGLMPSVLLAAAFAEVLRLWAEKPDFTLELRLFNRLPIHLDVRKLLGNFTTPALLEVRDDPTCFSARARRLQHQLAKDMEHLQYSSLRVMHERAHRRAGSMHAPMACVFASVVGTNAQGHDAGALQALGPCIASSRQTPNVLLEHQVAECQGALTYHWNVAEAMFPAGLVDDLFTCHAELLNRLLGDPVAWRSADRPARQPVPQRRPTPPPQGLPTRQR